MHVCLLVHLWVCLFVRACLLPEWMQTDHLRGWPMQGALQHSLYLRTAWPSLAYWCYDECLCIHAQTFIIAPVRAKTNIHPCLCQARPPLTSAKARQVHPTCLRLPSVKSSPTRAASSTRRCFALGASSCWPRQPLPQRHLLRDQGLCAALPHFRPPGMHKCTRYFLCCAQIAVLCT